MALVRILVVDDSDAWRSVIAGILRRSANWRVVSEASNGAEAVQRSLELHPDLVLMDLELTRHDGLKTARDIGLFTPSAKILFVGTPQSPEQVQEALDTGARGIVLKSEAALELVSAIQAVLKGTRFVSRKISPGELAGAWDA